MPLFTSLILSMLLTVASDAQTGNALVLTGLTYQIGFDRQTGGIRFIRNRARPADQGDICATGPTGSLWELHFRKRRPLQARHFADSRVGSMRHEWIWPNKLRMTYQAKLATVTVEAVAGDQYVDLIARVADPADDVLTLDLPASLLFTPAGLKSLIFPVESGLAIKRDYYVSQPPGNVWARNTVGEQGLKRVADLTCVMRPDSDAAVPVRPTKTARRLLGKHLAGAWQGRKCVVNRPISRQPDMEIIASPNGPLLAGHRIGKGLLLHLGGQIGRREAPLVAPTFERLLATLRAESNNTESGSDSRAPKRLVLLAMRNGPPARSRTPVKPADWLKVLPSSKLLQAAGLEVSIAAGIDEMLKALADARTFAVINPYGEAFPIGESKWQATADTIGAFIRNGGIWAETAGYPFYYALAFDRFYEEIHADYPGDFSDFAHLATTSGDLSIFGIQDLRHQDHIFVPARWRTYGDDHGGHIRRSWRTFVPSGQTWQAPTVRMLVGADVVSALRVYSRENGFARPLTDKMPPDLLQRWKRSVLVKYVGGTIADRLAMLDELPVPALVHLVDYLRGGFDKQYPDHLPPNPQAGTADEFRQLIRQARNKGHLVMPYTNPTWWCDEPKGPTFIKHGNAPLLRRLDGQLQQERYAVNSGWSICPWHPAALQAADRIVEQFTRRFPVDILLQDQIGARRMRYDTNPASPTPYAYVQGIFNLARRAEKHIPISTENGCDRLINIESQFCGLSWKVAPIEWRPAWQRLHREWLSDSAWEYFPLAQFLAADKVIFAHHDLGQFVTNREVLLWTLAMGYQLSYKITPADLAKPPLRNWLLYLDHIQKTIASAYIGKPLKSFRYLTGSGGTGVLETTFPGVRLVANATDKPYPLNDVVIAPLGFYAQAPNAEAGILSAYGGRSYEKDDLWLIRHGDQNRITVTVRARTTTSLTLDVDAPDRWQANPSEALVRRSDNQLHLQLTPRQLPHQPDSWQLLTVELTRQ